LRPGSRQETSCGQTIQGPRICCVHPDLRQEFDHKIKYDPTLKVRIVSGQPQIPWADVKRLLIDAEDTLRRDTMSLRERVKVLSDARKSSHDKDPKILPNDQEKSRSKSRLNCRICQVVEHKTADCPKRPGTLCEHFKQHGTCMYGSNCIFDHTETPPIPLNTSASLPPYDDPSATTTIETSTTDKKSDSETKVIIKCEKKISPDCEPTFTENKAYWDTVASTKGWGLPKSCPACRRARKIQFDHFPVPSANITAAAQQSDDDHDFLDDDEYAVSMITGLIDINNKP
jgi:hypothetical protein